MFEEEKNEEENYGKEKDGKKKNGERMYTVRWKAVLWNEDTVMAKSVSDARRIAIENAKNTTVYDCDQGVLRVKDVKIEKNAIEIVRKN